MPDEVVSPELVLVAPELAAVTWRREAQEPPRPIPLPEPVAETPSAPPTKRTVAHRLRRAAPYGGLAAAGLAAAFALPSLTATVSSSVRPAGVASYDVTVHGAVRASSEKIRRRFATTPPAPAPRDVLAVAISVSSRTVRLSWQPSPRSRRVLVIRSPGRAGASESVIYRGSRRGVVDRTVVPGTRYRYVVFGVTPAGRRSPGVPATIRP